MKLSSVLLFDDFIQFAADYSLFSRTIEPSFTVVVVYGDDILVVGNDLSTITIIKTTLDNHFKIKDMGTMKYFLNLEVACSLLGIFFNQRYLGSSFEI